MANHRAVVEYSVAILLLPSTNQATTQIESKNQQGQGYRRGYRKRASSLDLTSLAKLQHGLYCGDCKAIIVGPPEVLASGLNAHVSLCFSLLLGVEVFLLHVDRQFRSNHLQMSKLSKMNKKLKLEDVHHFFLLFQQINLILLTLKIIN